MLVILFVVLLCGPYFAASKRDYLQLNQSSILKDALNQMNAELFELNSILSNLSWTLSTNPNNELVSEVSKFGDFQIEWRNNWCFKLKEIFREIYRDRPMNVGVQSNSSFKENFRREFRQFYLLCRGPVYNSEQNRKLVDVLGKLENIYERSQVCTEYGTCFYGEPDMERIMTKFRNPDVLLWAWTEWRNKVGPPSRKLYPSLVSILNQGAKNNGYNEIGETWREELEVENLEELVEDLYSLIEPLYVSLHAVVRYKLHQYYGTDFVSLNQPIPAHLLGNMWAQNWGSLTDIIVKIDNEQTLTYHLNKRNFSVVDMVKKAEDFFVSLGFRPMTKAFWANSKLETNSDNGSTCHGTAANMFQPNDFRIILCAEINEEDFSVIHHELGHIQYYMEYEKQPAIFQDGVNSAFQESIGDAVMFGVLSPIHLYRLGVIKDIDHETDLNLLLHQALVKLPQIPFGLMLEKWRWNVFKGNILPTDYNKAWWALRERYQGVKYPALRTEEHFDPSAKFHINDNKPYIRYFLSSILQMQIFESLCKNAIYGKNHKAQRLPLPLHKCDIYGSKMATETLRHVMSLGSSISWKQALYMITGESSYSVRPLLEYYQPLYKWLLNEIEVNKIPVGWNATA